MKLRLAILLFTSALLLGTYWYQSNAAVCPTPIPYRLGEIDPDFDITEETALARLSEAELLWESAFNRNLFTYDETASFVVNFVFDDRQATADAEGRARQALDDKQIENEELFETIDGLQVEYRALVAQYDARRADYDQKLSEHNQEVAKYNDRGGAPSAVFARLEADRQKLESEAATLSTLANELNDMANELNRLSDEANRKISIYNREVATYNKKYGYSREFTQGDYQGGKINIYKFSSDTELVAVLAHEFGHALGIDHVEGDGSVMYYLLENTDEAPTLTESDEAAFYAVCGEKETTGQQLRRIIREFLAKF